MWCVNQQVFYFSLKKTNNIVILFLYKIAFKMKVLILECILYTLSSTLFFSCEFHFFFHIFFRFSFIVPKIHAYNSVPVYWMKFLWNRQNSSIEATPRTFNMFCIYLKLVLYHFVWILWYQEMRIYKTTTPCSTWLCLKHDIHPVFRIEVFYISCIIFENWNIFW